MPEVSFRISLRLSINKHRQEHLQTPFFALWASDLGFRKLIGPSFACVFRRVYKCFRLGRRPGSEKTTRSEIALFHSVGSTHGILLLKTSHPETQLSSEACSDYVFGFANETQRKTQAPQMYYKSRTAHVIFCCFLHTGFWTISLGFGSASSRVISDEPTGK